MQVDIIEGIAGGGAAGQAGDSTAALEDLTDSEMMAAIPQDRRVYGVTSTARDSLYYNMQHDKRGYCLVFVHRKFESPLLSTRHCAKNDAQLCREAFETLGFHVLLFKDFTTRAFLNKLRLASDYDHSSSDALVVVVMTHGWVDDATGQEYLHTYDGKIDTKEIWQQFTGNNCISLAGKPKLFFIQACRGEGLDHGVVLKVFTDAAFDGSKKVQEAYAIPAHADILIMWSSFEGMYAWKTTNNGVAGAVFIHYLTEVLRRDGRTLTLQELLLEVTRAVALEYESNCPGMLLDRNKQVPQTLSTLMRHVCFGPNAAAASTQTPNQDIT